MRSQLLLTLAALFFPITGLANPILEIVDLGNGAFDVRSTIDPAAFSWSTAGIAGQTFGGASFVYDVDPDTHENLLTQDVPIGTGRSDVTFVHVPAGQSATKRFDRRSAPLIVGRFVGGVGPPIATPSEIDVAWIDGLFRNLGSGFIARVALDLSATGLPGSSVVAGGDVPPDQIGQLLASGTVISIDDAFHVGSETLISWSVYVPIPEPGTLMLLLAGFVCVQRRKEALRCGT